MNGGFSMPHNSNSGGMVRRGGSFASPVGSAGRISSAGRTGSLGRINSSVGRGQLPGNLSKSSGVPRVLGRGQVGHSTGGRIADLSKGNLSNLVNSRSHGSTHGAGDLLRRVGDRAGHSSVSKLTHVSIGQKLGLVHLGGREVAKIDRKGLRDLVHSAAGDRHLGVGGKSTLHHGLPGKLTGVLASGHGFAPGGCYPSKKHGHHFDWWFGNCFGGSSWCGYGYGYPSYGYPDYVCYQPTYIYPSCETQTTYPEIITVSSLEPTVGQTFLSADGEPAGATTEPTNDGSLASDAETATDASEPATASAEPASEPATANPASAEPATAEPATLEVQLAASTEEPSSSVEPTDLILTEASPSDREMPASLETPASSQSRAPSVDSSTSDLDLELVDVEMTAPGDAAANTGPRFRVKVRNAGRRELGKFLVSLLACKDAAINSTSLHTSLPVEKLAAGEETTLDFTLPVAAASLSAKSAAGPYNTLIAAVDSDERIAEGNEENNLALVDRAAMAVAGR
jgi:hypothetical protein